MVVVSRGVGGACIGGVARREGRACMMEPWDKREEGTCTRGDEKGGS